MRVNGKTVITKLCKLKEYFEQQADMFSAFESDRLLYQYRIDNEV